MNAQRAVFRKRPQDRPLPSASTPCDRQLREPRARLANSARRPRFVGMTRAVLQLRQDNGGGAVEVVAAEILCDVDSLVLVILIVNTAQTLDRDHPKVGAGLNQRECPARCPPKVEVVPRVRTPALPTLILLPLFQLLMTASRNSTDASRPDLRAEPWRDRVPDGTSGSNGCTSHLATAPHRRVDGNAVHRDRHNRASLGRGHTYPPAVTACRSYVSCRRQLSQLSEGHKTRSTS